MSLTTTEASPASDSIRDTQLNFAVPDRETDFTFIDLFAGIGGMRLGFERAKGRCVFSSEIDRFARETYHANFGEEPAGDITKIDAGDVPDHDILIGGFPCQPFSIAGVTKLNSLGDKHGFENKTKGTLFFDVARIIKEKRPRAFLLENVRNLVAHDKGRTFEVIKTTLEDDLGYDIHTQIIDGAEVVPQHRERVYIVGFAKPTDFDFPSDLGPQRRLEDVLDPEPPTKYTLSEHLWQYLQDYRAKHRAKGNGFGFGMVDLDDPDAVTRTLSARYHKDGSEILIPQRTGPPRRLTPDECGALMGFPSNFKKVVSDTQAYRQFGNSVVVPVVEAIAHQMALALRRAN